tara:strand:- start:2845 stop:3270 length:426 start_codon:yes stop_codon:yes gene_type:complete
MPIYKTEILGSKIEISYQENEKEKLINLINNFKKRLEHFHINERVSNITVLFLAALTAEDQVDELTKKIKKNDINTFSAQEEKITQENLNYKIKTLKDELDEIKKLELKKMNSEDMLVSQVNDLEKDLESIKQKIIKVIQK